MAQTYQDFGDETTGVSPDGWVAGQGLDTLVVEEDASLTGGKYLTGTFIENPPVGMWDAIDTTSDIEIYTKWGDGATPFLGLFLSWDDSNTDGYEAQYQQGTININRHDSGSSTQLASVFQAFREEGHARLQKSGDTLRVRVWDLEDPEPSGWDVEETDSTYSGGDVGVNGAHIYDIVGVGTEGDPAPTEPLAQDIDGDVFAHDTDVASAAGVRTREASISSIDVDASTIEGVRERTGATTAIDVDAAAVTGTRTRGASIESIDVDLSTVAGETTAAGPWGSLEDLDPARARFGAAGLSGLVHVIGGANASTFSATDLVQEYNPDTDTWGAGTNLPRDMDNADAASDGSSIFLVGGDPNFTSPHTHVMEFDGTSWSDFEPLPTPRASVGLAANSDYVVVAGGRNDDGTIDDIDIYDRAADEWINTTHPGGVRDNLGVAIDGGVVYFGGGGNDSGDQDDFYRYDIDADTTTQLADLPLADRLSSMTFVNGTIFCTITNGDDPLPVYSVAHDEWHTSDDDPPDVGDGGGTYYDGYVYTGGGFSGGETWERLEQAVPEAHTNLEATYHE